MKSKQQNSRTRNLKKYSNKRNSNKRNNIHSQLGGMITVTCKELTLQSKQGFNLNVQVDEAVEGIKALKLRISEQLAHTGRDVMPDQLLVKLNGRSDWEAIERENFPIPANVMYFRPPNYSEHISLARLGVVNNSEFSVFVSANVPKRVSVRMLTGATHTVDINRFDTLDVVKQKVQQVLQVANPGMVIAPAQLMFVIYGQAVTNDRYNSLGMFFRDRDIVEIDLLMKQ